jgi:ABC-type polysaccharide transport system, permease component
MSKTALTGVKVGTSPGSKNVLWRRIIYNKYLYILFLPALAYYIVFSYMPMYGSILAFKDFKYNLGIFRSPWTSMYGFQHFYDLFSDMEFGRVFLNTIIISFQRIIFEFPVPIILALLLNEIRRNRFKRVVQTVLTFPHFVSWIVVSGIFFNLLSDSGVVNSIITALGGQKFYLLTEASTFRGLLYVSESWKEAGWNTIIYLAAIAGINPELYEAAIVDGAKRFGLVKYITWPAMRAVIGLLLVLTIANVMNAGFDQIFNLYNPAVYDKVDILDTFIYRRSFELRADFASSTAIGLFKSVVNCFMLVVANTITKKVNGQGIY